MRRPGVVETGLLLAVVGGAVGSRLAAGANAQNAALAAAFGAAAYLGGAVLARQQRRRAEQDTLAAAQRETEAVRREAEQARAERDALHRAVAHDLRSPLGGILNFTTVLEEDHAAHLDADARRIVRRIRRGAQAALDLLDGLSRLAKVGRRPLRVEPVDVEALVRRVFDELPADPARVELTVAPLPSAVADPALLATAFAELLSNAIKFSSHREKAHVGVGGQREADGSVLYCVADDGVGFDPRFASRLFGVFERLHSRDEFPGAGVGLAIVRRVAECHRGRAWAEGEPEQGARFLLSLPQPRGAP